MRKYLLALFILVPTLLFAQTIEETLTQIESLKKEIAFIDSMIRPMELDNE